MRYISIVAKTVSGSGWVYNRATSTCVCRACYARAPTEDQSLRHFKQSLATLHSQAQRSKTSTAPALRPLHPVHEKELP